MDHSVKQSFFCEAMIHRIVWWVKNKKHLHFYFKTHNFELGISTEGQRQPPYVNKPENVIDFLIYFTANTVQVLHKSVQCQGYEFLFIASTLKVGENPIRVFFLNVALKSSHAIQVAPLLLVIILSNYE